ncbi:inositol monophosphatase [Candidatus Micrarchaeota archaeon CG_4_10_14_0_2_um_filter_60_11]|nr:MAG: hypothetical protein AUJ16_04385 [Candidatus Micrarchaeota archaeon CG1_02_60_51]PIN95924.1 MAG: inositol monophosphatase [Candidatus Micrarchaeota archaeon CG10_big_fil_rev_8_21_14_0_10_60_32]PIO02114.1 MAG: inositol monophosphatase [Candidatus Micrarchaeota archaeon CG09_land_8_20_14_0_10_60_16]PIY91332.1 MAG: inositol monophosphatase [Candidatus Micrarchaeota archaeon CG_4_10_14_0_8_um_filter_60_7]PIZ90567.1 MAG: inositol monophosphatase [Candidatus Micrarchaeota archaeon CG_4_10_14_
MKEYNAALKAARRAGTLMNANFKKGLAVRYKGGVEPVTKVDLEVERLYKRAFAKFGHSFLGEETKSVAGDEYCWIIDPIDGTSNYVSGIPFYNTSVAFAKGDEVLFGIVYNPFTRELFHAEKGKGAFLNGERLRVKDEGVTKRSFLTFCAAGFEDKERAFDAWRRLKSRRYRQLGAAALELAFTACGRIDGVLLFKPKAWDVAAGMLLVREAGGKAVNFKGKDFKFDDDGLIAAGPKTAGQIRRGLR